MLKLKISGENRKPRIILLISQGIVMFLVAVFLGIMSYVFFFYFPIVIFTLLFLAVSILSFWAARQLIKLPPNS
jgi:hypothetical protein